MKRCPFCAQEVQEDAPSCGHCGEALDGFKRSGDSDESNLSWYFRKSFIIIAFCAVGPLALPLIWWHPVMKRGWKAAITIVVLIASWFLFLLSADSVRTITEYYKMLGRGRL